MDLRQQLQHTLGTAFILERELGGGGMSRVFVAEETRLGRKVVVKVLTPELTASISADRFEREIRLAASLQQANIVPLLSAGETDGMPYYTMPYVDGESLRKRLETGGAMPVAEAVSVLRDVARALAYAHDHGIVHRDIKPDNVLLSGGAAVVTDFGIAKALSAARSRGDGVTLTQMGTAIGTPAYIAPEQAAGDPDVDHRADIYSFGCLAYELLAGRSPFADRTPPRMMAAHMTEAPRAIAELRADVPESLARLVMHCLEKDPAARPQSAAELMTALADSRTLIDRPGMLWRALAVYAASVAAVAVLARAAIVGVGLPDWVFPGALIVMALGLPVLLFTAYAQHIARRSTTAAPGTRATLASRATFETLAMKASPHLSWRRSMLGGVSALVAFALLVGIVMLLRAFGIGPAGSLLANGRFSSKAPVLIADFATSNTDSSLGAVVSDAVRAALAQSSVISLVRPAQVASTLRLMRRPTTSRLDLTLARDVAQRTGVQAIVDGTVTAVPGGYIITLRLVSADSGADLASFRASGDGPRGLIDASDKLARELRGKIGESLRNVRATPPLAQLTTSSLDALRAYSAGLRANNTEFDPVKAVRFWREAARLDTSFAVAWSGVATALQNLGAPQAGIDSALERAYRNRDHLTEYEATWISAQYAANGPHRDRDKAAALFTELGRSGRNAASSFLNAGEAARTWRDYPAAEALNRAALKLDSANSVALFNLVQLQLDRGKPDSAAATLATIARRFPGHQEGVLLESSIAYANGDLRRTQQVIDRVSRSADLVYRQSGMLLDARMAMLHGELGRAARLLREAGLADTGSARRRLRDSLELASMHAWFLGANATDVSRIDGALARYPLHTLPAADRPYFEAATDYARAGNAGKAKAILASYNADVADTALLRLQSADLHNALGEVALAANDPRAAIAEFRRGDVGYDGKPARECGPCVELNLARAFDAANMADSTIAAYERFINTPYFDRLVMVDAVGLAGAHKRLGELYEAKGSAALAIAHDQKFIDLWKGADPELQPLVAEARRRVARLAAGEKR